MLCESFIKNSSGRSISLGNNNEKEGLGRVSLVTTAFNTKIYTKRIFLGCFLNNNERDVFEIKFKDK